MYFVTVSSSNRVIISRNGVQVVVVCISSVMVPNYTQVVNNNMCRSFYMQVKLESNSITARVSINAHKH